MNKMLSDNRKLVNRKLLQVGMKEFTCAICGVSELDSGRQLSWDHDHNSGFFRGLLCSNCNTGLGMFKDDVHILLKAIEYLIQFRDTLTERRPFHDPTGKYHPKDSRRHKRPYKDLFRR